MHEATLILGDHLIYKVCNCSIEHDHSVNMNKEND